MSFFRFSRQPNIDQGVYTYQNTPGSLLLDVRTPQEYGQGHIPGSKNLPLQAIDRIGLLTNDPHIPLFVYCHSGARSSEAVWVLHEMGYTHVRNIGGICSYLGKVERGSRRGECHRKACD